MSTWMFVEDEPDLYEIISALFELWGHDVIAFETGEDAVDWLDKLTPETDDLPELALIDLRLPGDIDGVEICKHIRASEALHQMPIIIATAYVLNPAQTDQIMREAQADLLLHKPLPTAAEFHAMLDELLMRRNDDAVDRSA